jgi:ABC-type polar amino acid transport system ATPase subunit
MDLSDYPLELPEGDRPMVRFMNVTKRYGSLTVLDDLDLDVAEGEMVTVIGPSGSGKTTVLRMLMTLETIDGGVIYVDGKPLTHMERGGGSFRRTSATCAGCGPPSACASSTSTSSRT